MIPGQSIATVNGVVIQPDGKILVLSSGEATGSVNLQIDIARFNSDGSVDTTFGAKGAGYVSLSFGTAASSTAGGIALQSNGKIVVDGSASTPLKGSEFGVARFNADGSVDPTFGTQGQVVATFDQKINPAPNPNSTADALAIQPDGKILVAGSDVPAAASQGGSAVARLNADGSFDTTFASVGELILTSTQNGATGVAVSPDGGIILVGTAAPTEPVAALGAIEVVKLTSAGVADPGFQLAGLPSAAAMSQTAVATVIQPDGKILLTINGASGNAAVLRLDANGQADATFGAGGLTVLPPVGNSTAFATSVAVQADGRVLVGTAKGSFTVYRLLASETLGDYTGDGKADVAVYLPSVGAFAIRPSQGGLDQIVPFGIPGAGNSIPTPGDYDASGKTEISVYLPTVGGFAYRPANGGAGQDHRLWNPRRRRVDPRAGGLLRHRPDRPGRLPALARRLCRPQPQRRPRRDHPVRVRRRWQLDPRAW